MIFVPVGPPYGSLLTYIVKSSNIYTFHGQIFIHSDILIFFVWPVLFQVSMVEKKIAVLLDPHS